MGIYGCFLFFFVKSFLGIRQLRPPRCYRSGAPASVSPLGKFLQKKWDMIDSCAGQQRGSFYCFTVTRQRIGLSMLLQAQEDGLVGMVVVVQICPKVFPLLFHRIEKNLALSSEA